jgi:preprotein translocase subunit SecG
MSIINSIWLSINIILILLILIRSPNEQSLQETIGPLKLFDSSGSAEKTIDNGIQILIISYFIIGFILTSKVF